MSKIKVEFCGKVDKIKNIPSTEERYKSLFDRGIRPVNGDYINISQKDLEGMSIEEQEDFYSKHGFYPEDGFIIDSVSFYPAPNDLFIITIYSKE